MSTQGIATSDFLGLNELKMKAHTGSKEALPEAAKQFEGIFLQAMLKSMRSSSQFLDDSSPFKSKHEEDYRDMLDGQYASSISGGPGIGLADMLSKQLQVNKTEETNTTSLQGHSLSKSLDVKEVQHAAKPEASMPAKHEKSGSLVGKFVKSILPYAKEAASLLGLDPKILIAQAALETGWGMFVAKGQGGESSNNLFNVKASNQSTKDAVSIKTTEYVGGKPVKTTDSFRKYSSIADSFKDYVSFIKENDRYQGALDNVSNPERFVDELHRAGYATDPNYVKKILTIFHSEELRQAMLPD